MTEIKFERAGMAVVFTDTELKAMAKKLRMLALVYPDGERLAEFNYMADVLDSIAAQAEDPTAALKALNGV